MGIELTGSIGAGGLFNPGPDLLLSIKFTAGEKENMMTRISRRWLAAALAISMMSTASAKELRKFIAADSSKQRVAMIGEDGRTEWEYRIGPLHDLHVLPNGHVLFQTSWTEVLEVDPADGRVVWSHDSARRADNQGVRLEIHAFQRLNDGSTMIAESGPGKLVELSGEQTVLKTVALRVSKPDAHRDTRLVRKLASGNYLVCHEGDGLVREYDGAGKTVWEYKVPLFDQEPKPGHGVEAFGNQAFSAIRLKNGNTLIGTGNGHSVLEVTPAGEIVWSLRQNDLPGIQFAWITSLQVLPSGNILINNCHAGEKNPQLVEVTRAKEVVWAFHDFERFGDSLTNSQILTVNGKPITADEVVR